jgi:dolichol-phosphate mannosyltransferase
MDQRQLEVVIPVFDEIEIVEQLHTRVSAVCDSIGLPYRVVYVDDGSSDGTATWLADHAVTTTAAHNHRQRRQVALIELSRNFGQPSAILAGLEQCRGGCVVVMDGDLQDPPELIADMVERWQQGDEVVIAQRTSRQETFLRGLAFRAFHKMFRVLSDSDIPPNTGTFCLLDRKAADAMLQLPESHRFFPGLRAWVGFRQSLLTFKRPPRAGGEPKQTFSRLIRYALDAIFGFSLKPLRMLTMCGTVTCIVAFMFAAWFVVKRALGWETASIGFTTLTCAVLGLGGFQMVGLGLLGEYIGRIYDEVKGRPQYLIARQRESLDMSDSAGQPANQPSDGSIAISVDSRRIAG